MTRTTRANASDRNAKENFQPVNASDVLEKVAALRVSEWNHKSDTSSRTNLTCGADALGSQRFLDGAAGRLRQ